MADLERLIESLPAAPGSYVLYMRLARALRLPVGRLGTFTFATGDYLYVGSAFGPGGMRARLRHHARISTTPHWHLDALRPYVELLGGWYSTGEQRLECTWSRALAAQPGVTAPAPGFGASDCRSGCIAHLFANSSGRSWADVEALLRVSAAPGMVVAPFGG
jgi:Uri superfamily endonuclease